MHQAVRSPASLSRSPDLALQACVYTLTACDTRDLLPADSNLIQIYCGFPSPTSSFLEGKTPLLMDVIIISAAAQWLKYWIETGLPNPLHKKATLITF